VTEWSPWTSRPATTLSDLRTATARGRVDAPALGGAVARVSFDPSCMALVGMLTGLHVTLGATSGGSIAPDLRDRIAAEGMWEASQNISLAANAKGARFERIDLSISVKGGHASVLVRADPGPGFEAPRDEVWAPTFTVVNPSAAAPRSFDVSRPFLGAWTLPGIGDRTALDPKPFLEMMRDAGWSGMMVGLPDVTVAAARLLDTGGLTPDDAVLARLSRFGLTEVLVLPAAKKEPASSRPSDVFLGVLPDGTPRSVAACVLAGPPPCGPRALTVGATSKDGDLFVRLTEVEKHFVLVRAHDRDAVALKLKASSAGPLRLGFGAGEWSPSQRPDSGDFGSFAGTLRREDRAVVFELTSE
jgi:hypothetical protein